MGWIDVAGDLASTFLGDSIADDNARKAWQRQQKMFAKQVDVYSRRYQITMADMLKAGLNPILALSRGGMQVGAGVSAPPPGPMSNFQPNPSLASSAMSNMSTARKSEEEAKKATAEREKVLAETAKTREEVKKVLDERLKIQAETGKITDEQKKLVQEVKNLEEEWFVLSAQYSKLLQETDLAKSRNRLTRQQTANLKSQRRQIIELTRKLEAEADKLRKFGDVYKGPIGKLIAYTKEVREALGLSGSGNLSGAGALIKQIK